MSAGVRIPVGARFSSPVETGPGAYPAFYTMGPGVKRPGRGANHPPPSSAEVKGRIELYFYSPSGPSWHVLGRTLPLPLPLHLNISNSLKIKSSRRIIAEDSITGEFRYFRKPLFKCVMLFSVAKRNPKNFQNHSVYSSFENFKMMT